MIFTVCLSPAFQKILVFSNFGIDKVNRSKKVIETIGGKGINAARAAALLSDNVKALTVLGGARRKEFIEYAKKDRISLIYAEAHSDIRTCYTLLNSADNSCTEIVEESPEIEKSVLEEFKLKFEDAIKTFKPSYILFSGSVPKGTGASYIPELVRVASSNNIEVMLDMTGRLLADSCCYGRGIIKVNEREFHSVFASDIPYEDLSVEIIRKISKDIFKNNGYRTIITRGEDDTLVFYDNEILNFPTKHVAAFNTTGCGDVFAGALLGVIDSGESYLKAVEAAQIAAADKACQRLD